MGLRKAGTEVYLMGFSGIEKVCWESWEVKWEVRPD